MDFLPIRIATLKASSSLLFDVYVQYNNQYLHYKKANDSFEEALLQKFKKHKIKKVFIPAAQEDGYLNYLDQSLAQLQDKTVDVQKKAEMAAETVRFEAENIQKNLDSEEGFNRTKQRLGAVADFMTQTPGAIKEMLASAGLAVDNSQHSSNVANLSMALSVEVGLKDQEELLSISIASLLHDVGKEKLGLDPMVTLAKATREQKLLIFKHPQAAVDMLAGKKFITPRILRLIADHEEIGDGQGYPEKKRLKKLPLSSQVFNLCNRYDHVCMDAGKTGTDGFAVFMEQFESCFDPQHLMAFEKLLV